MTSRVIRLLSGPFAVAVRAIGQGTPRRLRAISALRHWRTVPIVVGFLFGAVSLCALFHAFPPDPPIREAHRLILGMTIGGGLGAIAGVLAAVDAESRE